MNESKVVHQFELISPPKAPKTETPQSHARDTLEQ